MDTLSVGRGLSKLFLPPSEKGSTLQGKTLSQSANSFLRVDPFSEGA